MSRPARDPAAIITALIIEKLEAGTLPWSRPWETRNKIPLRHNGEPYTGINALYLGLVGDVHGHASPYWMTYRQAEQLGAQVRRGEKSEISVYYHVGTKDKANPATGATDTGRYSFLKAYAVFNAAQIDGLPGLYFPEPAPPKPATEIRANAQAFFDAIPVTTVHRGDQAYYSPSSDLIVLPERHLFKSPDLLVSTRAHETIHATGAKHRLNRTFGKRFGDHDYAREELVAAIGQSIICAELGLPDEIHDNHASYVANWITHLKNDKTAIIKAASKAEQAVKWIRQNAAPAMLEAA